MHFNGAKLSDNDNKYTLAFFVTDNSGCEKMLSGLKLLCPHYYGLRFCLYWGTFPIRPPQRQCSIVTLNRCYPKIDY